LIVTRVTPEVGWFLALIGADRLLEIEAASLELPLTAAA
jgi:hypothetical protein